MVFSARIFRNLDLGIEWVLRCKPKTLFTHASNPWWWPMKGPKALGTILVNSSTNSNLKARHLSIRKPEGILIKLYRQNVSLLFNQTCLNERLLLNHTHTHTHTHVYIYNIYIYICVCVCVWHLPGNSKGF